MHKLQSIQGGPGKTEKAEKVVAQKVLPRAAWLILDPDSSMLWGHL